MIQAKEKDFSGADASIERGIVVVEMFKIKSDGIPGGNITCRGSQMSVLIMLLAADFYLEALDMIEHSVIASELQVSVPRIFAGLAIAQVRSNQLEAAERSLASGFRLDSSEPTFLWLVKARLQQAQDMPQLALASVNYALAIWKDADDDYIMAGKDESAGSRTE